MRLVSIVRENMGSLVGTVWLVKLTINQNRDGKKVVVTGAGRNVLAEQTMLISEHFTGVGADTPTSLQVDPLSRSLSCFACIKVPRWNFRASVAVSPMNNNNNDNNIRNNKDDTLAQLRLARFRAS